MVKQSMDICLCVWGRWLGGKVLLKAGVSPFNLPIAQLLSTVHGVFPSLEPLFLLLSKNKFPVSDKDKYFITSLICGIYKSITH